jgi:hypothetical protein
MASQGWVSNLLSGAIGAVAAALLTVAVTEYLNRSKEERMLLQQQCLNEEEARQNEIVQLARLGVHLDGSRHAYL